MSEYDRLEEVVRELQQIKEILKDMNSKMKQ